MQALDLINPTDSPERRLEKMVRINSALMRRVEQPVGGPASSFEQFQRAVLLEEEVRERTADLEETLRLLNTSNAQLARATEDAQAARTALANALEAIQEGFALFAPDGAMVLCNSRFCEELPELRPVLKAGLMFEDYVRMVSQSPRLDLQNEERTDWLQKRLALHREQQARFNMRFRSGSWLQVSEQKTPDGGSAIIQTDITEMIGLERAERERLLDDQARMVRATLDHMDEGVAIFDAQAQLVGWNTRLGELLAPPMRLVRIGVRFEALFSAVLPALTFDDVDADGIRDWVAYGRQRPPL
ncbi:MAG: PAS-domain containing protein, partial [Pseudomonadota bacterium]